LFRCAVSLWLFVVIAQKTSQPGAGQVVQRTESDTMVVKTRKKETVIDPKTFRPQSIAVDERERSRQLQQINEKRFVKRQLLEIRKLQQQHQKIAEQLSAKQHMEEDQTQRLWQNKLRYVHVTWCGMMFHGIFIHDSLFTSHCLDNVIRSASTIWTMCNVNILRSVTSNRKIIKLKSSNCKNSY
jgi:hypothetical protein